jgi:hypothetical protein
MDRSAEAAPEDENAGREDSAQDDGPPEELGGDGDDPGDDHQLDSPFEDPYGERLSEADEGRG